MRGLLLPLLLGAAFQPASTVPPAPPPAALPTTQPASDGEQLAFADMGNRMTVPVQIGVTGPFRFIVDTGAQRTVVSRELAGALGLAPGHDVRVIDMVGTTVQPTVMVPAISVSALGGAGIEAPALSQIDLGAPGMLGIDSLQGHAVTIDFAHQVMTVVPSTRRLRNERTLPGEIVVRARSLFGELIVTDAYCDGQRVRVVLDTGSVVSMGNLALQRRFAHRRPGDPITLTSVSGRSMTANYTTLQRVKIGGITISSLPIAYADAPPFERFGLQDTPAILLGMDALRLFKRVRIDFANKEVRLQPPPDSAVPEPPNGWQSIHTG